MANIITVTNELGALATNCYTVVNTETREAIVIDPGDRGDFLIDMYKNQNYKLTAIFLTHGHFDHMGGVGALRNGIPDIKVYIGRDDEDVLSNPNLNLSTMMGIVIKERADVLLEDGQELDMLGTKIKCIQVSGHTKGGMCFYFPEEKLLFSGDTLFHCSVGRSDFPTGDGDALISNIKNKLLILPDEVSVFPGHDSRTTIKTEKARNPYFK